MSICLAFLFEKHFQKLLFFDVFLFVFENFFKKVFIFVFVFLY
jgi:hypothetical protein